MTKCKVCDYALISAASKMVGVLSQGIYQGKSHTALYSLLLYTWYHIPTCTSHYTHRSISCPVFSTNFQNFLHLARELHLITLEVTCNSYQLISARQTHNFSTYALDFRAVPLVVSRHLQYTDKKECLPWPFTKMLPCFNQVATQKAAVLIHLLGHDEQFDCIGYILMDTCDRPHNAP